MGCGCNRRNFSSLKLKNTEVVPPPVKKEVQSNSESRKQRLADALSSAKERHAPLEDLLAKKQQKQEHVQKQESKPVVQIPINFGQPKQAPVLSRQQKQEKKPSFFAALLQKIFKK